MSLSTCATADNDDPDQPAHPRPRRLIRAIAVRLQNCWKMSKIYHSFILESVEMYISMNSRGSVQTVPCAGYFGGFFCLHMHMFYGEIIRKTFNLIFSYLELCKAFSLYSMGN